MTFSVNSINGSPTNAVNALPQNMPFMRSSSVQFPNEVYISASVTAEKSPRIFPESFPPPSLSKKNSDIPIRVAITAIISALCIFCLKKRYEKINIKTGDADCKTMALAAVVILLELTNNINVRHRNIPVVSDFLSVLIL